MSVVDPAALRQLVREVVREAVADLAAPPTAAAVPPPPAPPPPPPAPRTVAEQFGLQPTGPLAADDKTRTDTIRIANDADLDAFVRTMLKLFENPKTRADLRAGRLKFRLAGGATSTGDRTHRIDSGAVTERHIADIAESGGGTLILGRRAVVTPLAREKARALGIKIEKERK
ncbi:Uncharacterised protein [Mycolicibacterium phlei]|uniref:Uncharacterized protein n=1 Tax=Mycolicibacterium phlei DSM 43239 = CCUG 21000 TaxID=1226750 RepID=A0A5N5V5F1_MYCPH|nr:hypothetical protein [Mycolicibacterium phlei]VEG07266.1 Uncharacterised protein [Mycobacteroides chelonae]AMO59134.1 hypothetical protein MPHLCCUG_00292 [Mycolicibacterium phlei]KAB7757153.1 hypothetical protein MPHL21000_08115 [Mycolicibacterium phlei DSM 43239 = CCUG 21000]KXW64996.1 hypothetical protein MPHL43239_10205 [Mycolicibacterium phlei DSM 43239 = CCUG 21000]KXW72199.1 hypothetical protein MPHL43072_00045 [Mycolicibacterium phlei DSM 43072]